MALEVFDECIKNYARSPDEQNNYLAHYGVKSMSWGEHKYGKWQNHARYAMGDRRHTDGTPMTYEGKRMDSLKETLKGKPGKTPRTDFSNLSDEELINRTNRLNKENNYLKAMKEAEGYDKYFIDETKKVGAIDVLGKKMAKTLPTAAKNITRTGAYKLTEWSFGKEAADMLFYNKNPGDGKKGNNKNDKKGDGGGNGKKNEEWSEAAEQKKMLLDAYKEIYKRKGAPMANKEAAEWWNKMHPDNPLTEDEVKDFIKGKGGGNTDGDSSGDGGDGGGKKGKKGKNKGDGGGGSEGQSDKFDRLIDKLADRLVGEDNTESPKTVRETANTPMNDPSIRRLFDRYDSDNNGLLDITEVNDIWDDFMSSRRYHNVLDTSIANDYQDIINNPSLSSSTNYSPFVTDMYKEIFKK